MTGGTRRRLVLIGAVVAGVLAFVTSLAALPTWLNVSLGAVGLVAGLYAAVSQYRNRGAYARPFRPTDWQLDADGETRSFVILARDHGRGATPTTSFYIHEDDGKLHEADTGMEYDRDGNITVRMNVGPFDPPGGEVRVVD